MKNIELFLKGVGKIDLEKGEIEKFGLELNFSIDNLSDLSKRKSNYSKEFKLLGTQNNNKKLGHIYDINFTDLTYNLVNRKDAYLTVNGEIVIDGYLKIRKIEKTYIAGKYQIIYTVNIYDNSKDFFQTIGEKKLQELDFSNVYYFENSVYNTGDHYFDISAIQNSQNRTKTYTNVYDYAIVNYKEGVNSGTTYPDTTGVMELAEFYPSIYLKAIVDKIFLDAGYTYTSLFLNGLIYDNYFPILATIYNGNIDNSQIIGVDQNIILSNYLPDINQVDFINSLIIQFNLYVEVDKNNSKNLIIDPRNEYYSSGEIIDWTKKVNYTNILIEPMSNVIKRDYYFNMKDIKSIKTDAYKDIWGYNYGSTYKSIENDNYTGDNKYDSIYSGYDYNYFAGNIDKIFVPNLVSKVDSTQSDEKQTLPPMIGFLKSVNTSPYTWELDGVGLLNNWNTINHVTILNTNQYNLNYENFQGTTGYDDAYTTFFRQNLTNLFNNNQRKITYMVNVNEIDIKNLSFKNPLSIDRELYYINSLVTDITDGTNSKLELIKAFDYNPSIIPEVNFWSYGGVYLGYNSGASAGANRPVASVGLISMSNKLYEDYTTNISFKIYHSDYYNYFCVPATSPLAEKNYWYVDEFNNGEIGGDVNLGGNLIPSPDIINYNGQDYYVYIFNYQTSDSTDNITMTFKNSI